MFIGGENKVEKNTKIQNILENIVDKGASDIFIVAGSPLIYKLKGRMVRFNDDILKPQDTKEIITQVYDFSNKKIEYVEQNGEDDFSFSIKGAARFRANCYKQRGSLACAIRIVPFDIPDYKKLLIPDEVMNFADEKNGLVLVTGSSGSGKSTTLSCIIDRINKTRDCHIVTIEDPIETLHSHNKSIVSQREVMTDTNSYLNALKSSLRQAPDVILLGELRDYETIDTAMTAAETGHLIFSSLHTVGASNTIDRIIDVFPPNQQHQIRTQLSMVLRAVVSQQLIPSVSGDMVAAFEIMVATNAVKNMIRESKIFQIDSTIFSSSSDGMLAMDTSILNLYNEGLISRENALLYSRYPTILEKKL